MDAREGLGALLSWCLSMILCACACACACARELTCARLTSRARASVCVRVRAGQVAAISGQKKVVHRLVELNADVNARDAQVRSGVAARVMCRKHARDVQECLRACVHTVIQCLQASGRANPPHTRT